jgi:poly(A) polymerase Pap1
MVTGRRLAQLHARRQQVADAISLLACGDLHELVNRRGATVDDVQLGLVQVERTAAEVLRAYKPWARRRGIPAAAVNKVWQRLVQQPLPLPLTTNQENDDDA